MLSSSLLRTCRLWILLSLSGCNSWSAVAPETIELPSARMSTDSVTLQITFVRVPAGDADFNRELWRQIDEQTVSPGMRTHLNNNGFRCGSVGLQLPRELRQLLDEKESQSLLEASSQREIDSLSLNRRVSCRAGKRSEIITAATSDEIIVLHRSPDSTKVTGKSFRQAQSILAARPYPHGDGHVRIEITPEIHHGPPRQQWIAGEGTFHFLAAREREMFSDLTMHMTLMPGHTLVVSCTPESKGLGHNFFVDTSHGDPQQKLLLIRLAQTQRDDIFESESQPSSAPASD